MIQKLATAAEGQVRYLLLDKPSRLNALDREMLEGIEALIARWESEGAAVMVLGSTGERAFCVGADIAELSTFDAAAMERWELLGSRVFDRLERSPIVSVARMPRFALGGGLTLALACDFRIASEDCQFAQPEIELGWIPGWGGMARLVRAVGIPQAKRLAMTGERIGAAEAVRIGLAHEAVPPSDLQARTKAFADALAARGGAALAAIKAAANAPPATSDPAGWKLDALTNAALLNDPRGQAAIARFLSRKEKQA